MSIADPNLDSDHRSVEDTTLLHHTVPQKNTQPEVSSPKKMSILWFGLLLFATMLTVVVLRSSTGPQDSPAVGKPAPRLDLIQLTDQSLDQLQSIQPGEVTLIHFWGTWCGPCKMEYPQLADATARLSTSDRFRLVSVSCESGPGETFEGLWRKTSDYLLSEGIDHIAFADPQGITRRSMSERLERRSMFFPTTIVVDASGVIQGVWEGYSPDGVPQMEMLVNQLLASAS